MSERRPPTGRPQPDPEALTRALDSLRHLGRELVQLLRPVGDAVTAAYGSRVAASLERQAAEALDPSERARLRSEAARVSAATSRAWHRLCERKRAAETDRADTATGGERRGDQDHLRHLW